MPAGFARRDRLRHSLEDSPKHVNRIKFTAAAFRGGLCYGLVVLVPLLSTPLRSGAVTVRYRTALRCTEADFHCSIPTPSQAHERGRLGRSNSLTTDGPRKTRKRQPGRPPPYTSPLENSPRPANSAIPPPHLSICYQNVYFAAAVASSFLTSVNNWPRGLRISSRL